MILSILYLLFYAAAGVLIGRYLFSTESFPRRLWLGLTLGLFGSIWLPSLFSFVLGFGTVSHILGAVLMAVLTFLCLLQKKKAKAATASDLCSFLPLMWLLPIFLVGAYLFSTHILQPKLDGYYVGQTTYGDLAMHLGFISCLGSRASSRRSTASSPVTPSTTPSFARCPAPPCSSLDRASAGPTCCPPCTPTPW